MGTQRAAMGIVVASLLVGCGSDDGPSGPPGAPPGTSATYVQGVIVGEPGYGPCKLTFEGLDGTLSPSWSGEGMAEHVGVQLAPGVIADGNRLLLARCYASFRLPTGRHRVTASLGPELDAWVHEITLRPDDGFITLGLAPEMVRSVDSDGWACGDLHVHSAPSVDSDVPLDQRLVSALVEGLDLIVASDHDTLGDWALARASLGRVEVIAGNEISPGVGDEDFKGHFNVFPIPETLSLPRDMPHLGLTVEQIFRAARTAAPGALVQINHPRSDPYFGYFTLIDFDPAIATGRLTELASDFDLVEVWNGHGLDNGDAEVPVDVVLEDWLALLRAGRGAVATGNSDTHRLSRTPVGYPRTCARIADDGPDARRADAFVDALRVGDAFVTSGPFLDVTVEGEGLGRTVRARDGRVEVTVHAQAASWVPLDEVAVWLDGEEIERTRVTELPWSGGFDVPVTRDAFVIVVARGDEPLGVPAGAPLSPMRSFAFTNPVFVDADGDGMWTR